MMESFSDGNSRLGEGIGIDPPIEEGEFSFGRDGNVRPINQGSISAEKRASSIGAVRYSTVTDEIGFGLDGGEISPLGLVRRSFSVFVDNLPKGITRKGLFDLFGKYGKVCGLFISHKRRRSSPLLFAFVRFQCKVGAEEAIKNVDGMKMGNGILSVHKPFHGCKDSFGSGRKEGRVTVRPASLIQEGCRDTEARERLMSTKGNSDSPAINGIAFRSGSYSSAEYAQVFSQIEGMSIKHNKENNSIPIVSKAIRDSFETSGSKSKSDIPVMKYQEDIRSSSNEAIDCRGSPTKPVGDGFYYGNGYSRSRKKVKGLIQVNDWEQCAAIALLRNGKLFYEMRGAILDSCSFVRSISLFKDNAVIIVFHSSFHRGLAIEHGLWSHWFHSVKAWVEGKEVSGNRIWVECVGIPFYAWNMATFEAIARVWGSIIEVEQGTAELVQLEVARFCISTHESVIEEFIELEAGGFLFSVHVSGNLNQNISPLKHSLGMGN